MKTFAGKFQFLLGNYKLILWEQRLGLITKDRTTIRKNGSDTYVPLPADAGSFLAIAKGDGTFVLQASNGEIVSFNENTPHLIATTLPTGMPLYHVPVLPLRLTLERLRSPVGGKVNLRFYLDSQHPDKTKLFDLICKPHFIEVDDINGSRYLSNLNSTPAAGDHNAIWTAVQLGDGVDQMQASKTVTHFDFTPAGAAIVELSGENLAGINFGRANFSRALLKDTILTGGTFNKASFSRATLSGADFSGSAMTGVDFTFATMKGTKLNTLTGGNCDFSDCDLLTVINSAPLVLTSTAEAPMRFVRSQLKYSLIGKTWSYKILAYAKIMDLPATIDDLNATFADVTAVDLSTLSGARANFNNAIMRGVKLSNANLPSAQFKASILEATLELPAADFTSAILTGCSFENALLSGASFSGARMDETKFDGATLRLANFSNAYLKAVSFSAVEQKMMTGVTFTRAFLVGCDFSNADLSTYDTIAVNMTGAYLQGANFTGAKLDGTFLTDAGISEGEGSLTVNIGKITFPVTYEATEIDPELSTSANTTCPIGAAGPCTGNKMHTHKTFPTSWPPPARLKQLQKKRRQTRMNRDKQR
ncbi:pentapeptide repeat-containing protein [Undibacterium sp. Tian12W]|uniref:pentapeptide repeat-containing protein n=1 Tax=Undibacterium sp. Tian12W TaxID=3413054 RepID=UPI003BF20B3C